MAWIKFPNQINDLLKLRRSLAVASGLKSSELRDDGIYGQALLDASIIRTKKSKQEQEALPFSRQPHRTRARGLRELFVLIGCMAKQGDNFVLTTSGKAIAKQLGPTITPTEQATWQNLISSLTFPHRQYPSVSPPGIGPMRPAHVVLAMLEKGPLPAQGLALAFSAKDESMRQINQARSRAERWSTEEARVIANEVGTTESELRNNSKVFPGMLEQLGLIRRVGGTAYINPAGLLMLGAAPPIGTQPRASERRNHSGRPKGRPIRPNRDKPWSPNPVDPDDLAERSQLRLLKLERANKSHQAAVEAAAGWLQRSGFKTLEADYDILAQRGSLWLLIEVKSVSSSSVRSQVMRAIGQLAYYAAVSIPRPRTGVRLIRGVLLDQAVSDERMQRVLDQEGICLMWVEGDGIGVADSKLLAEIGNKS